MARHPRKDHKRRKHSNKRNQELVPSLESLNSLDSVTSLTNQSINLLVDNIFRRQGVKMRKPTLSTQEKRDLRKLLMNLQDRVEKLTKSTKE
ncbi:hypothetical protein D1B33_10515 [Lysinibacillus yapensis]|uniref:Spore coat protein n=1 Tax=Ureibacillus yapensis TaxID=2304605 RepID=A0A396SBF7_9BACL|nr:hypothetical protein [Lysinibacillus yapensis]RHW36813.1 hypothetical protein D1B33_10515 [Lysinibacillus yapensis]